MRFNGGSRMRPGADRLRTVTIGAVLLVVVLGLGGLAWHWRSQADDYRKNPQLANEQLSDELLKKVGVLVELPKDEKPSVQTVQDSKQLGDVPFFKDSKNGDRLIVYEKANKAILYRPSENKVVRIAPAFDTPSRLRIVVLDAAKNPAKAKQVNEQIVKDFNNVSVVSTNPTASVTTKGVTVVDLSKQSNAAAEQLAESLKGSVGDLPKGQASFDNIDLVVLVGS